MSETPLSNRTGQVGLIALLVTLVIAALLVYVFLGPNRPSGQGGPETIPGKAIEKAHDTECQANLRTIRQAIQMQRSVSEAPPASIRDIQVGTSDPNFFKCPVGGQDYIYDSQSGTIRCPHSGHEVF